MWLIIIHRVTVTPENMSGNYRPVRDLSDEVVERYENILNLGLWVT